MSKEVLESLLRQKEELEGKLKKRQIKFCEYYIASNCNGAEAARAVGCKEKSARQMASRWLTNVDIAAYTRVLQKIAVEKSGLSSEYVTLARIEILQKCLGGKPEKVWDYDKHEMVDGPNYNLDAKNALKALEALDKTLKGAEGKNTGDVLIKFENAQGEKWGG